MTFDVNRQRVVLLGGETAGGPASDTWEWDGASWTQIQDLGPGPSLGGAMVFDGAEALFFGGASSADAMPPPVLLGGTWDWSGATWTQRQDFGPSPRWGHAMAFDSERGHPVLFGGVSVPPGDGNVATSVLGDTWEAVLEPDGGAAGPPPDPGPAFTITAPYLIAGSWLGSVQIQLDSPRAADTPVVVSVDGGPEPSASVAIPAGQTDALRFFPLGVRGLGPLDIGVEIDGRSRTTTTQLFDGPAIIGFGLTPETVSPNQAIQVDVVLNRPAPNSLAVQVANMDAPRRRDGG